MNRVFSEGLKFENLRFKESALETGDYESCTFRNCDFSDSDLSCLNFLECEFRECNFSLTRLNQTSLREIRFINSKLLGLHFEDSDSLIVTFDFDNCILELCSFYKLKLQKTIFKNSKIIEADFTEADLTKSSFINCDLQRTIFNKTNLEGVDFRTSFNYSIDPDSNRIKKAKFSLPWVAGLLDKFDIEIDK